MIEPKSLAGILLREHDCPEQAVAYAERKASALLAMNNGIGLDYAQAAQQIRAEIGSHREEEWKSKNEFRKELAA